MPATRSKAKQQSASDNPGVASQAAEHTGAGSSSNKKRSAASSASISTRAKRPKTSSSAHAQAPHDSPAKDTTDPPSTTIMINRAPVLQLWSAVVAQKTHPVLSWQTCLSIGSTISALCAVSKGRAIGLIGDKNDDTAEKSHNQKIKPSLERVHVMTFDIPIKDGLAQMSGKPKPAGEDALKAKFGDEPYASAKSALEDSLSAWKDTEELNKRAFGFYEKFRPTVAAGQKGWGRKAQFDLDKVKHVVAG